MDKTVAKVFLLLETLSTNDEAIGITELAKKTNLGKSNVHRLLQTLIELKYVRKNIENNYETTLRMWEMGNHTFSRISLRGVARPYLRNLAQMSKETIHLSELHGLEVLYIDKIESQEPVRAYTQLGGRAPAYCTATGKVMIAYIESELISSYYENAQQFTSKTIVNSDRFIVEANDIREKKYAINRGEWSSEVIGVAAPIVNNDGMVVAAIGLSAPASRMQLSELEMLAIPLVQYAEKISLALGCLKEKWSMLGMGLNENESR